MSSGIMQGESAAYILDANAGPAPPVGTAVEGTCVLDLDVQGRARRANVDTDLQAVVAPTMLDRILDQRLQQEARDAAGHCLRVDMKPHLEALTEARLLDPEVGGQSFDFSVHRHDGVID